MEGTPTKKSDFVKAGDVCKSVFTNDGGMKGTVERIVRTPSIHAAVVLWESGARGRHTLTTLKRVEGENMNNNRRKRIDEVKAKIEELKGEVEALRDEEEEAFQNMPEGLQQSERGQQSEQAVDALNEAADAFDTIVEALETAME